MKKIYNYINLLLVALLLGTTLNAQETESYRQNFGLFYNDYEDVETTETSYTWKVTSSLPSLEGASIEWFGYTENLDQPHTSLYNYKKNSALTYVGVNPVFNQTLKANINHPTIKGISRIELIASGKATRKVETFINGVSYGVNSFNKNMPVVIENMDVEGAFDIELIGVEDGGNAQIKEMIVNGWTPVKATSAYTSEDGLSMELPLDRALAPKDTTMTKDHGFSVAVDTKPWEEEVGIEKVTTSSDGEKVIIFFTNPTYRHHNILLSYDRNMSAIADSEGNSLESYDQLVVTNNSPILPPELRKPVQTNEAGDQVIIVFDKDMKVYNYSDGSGFTVRGSVSGSLAIESLYTHPDNADRIILELVTPADVSESLVLSYTGEAIQSTDEGYLAEFSDFPLVNGMTGADAELQLDPRTDLLGEYIRMDFSKDIDLLPVNEIDSFEVYVNGVRRPLVAIQKGGYDDLVDIYLSTPTVNIDVIEVKFKGGTFTTTEGSAIRPFELMPVRNLSPGVPPVSIVANTLGAGDTIAAVVEFDILLRNLTISNIKKGDFVIEIIKNDGTVVKDSVENFRWINSLKHLAMDFTKPVAYSDSLHLYYTGTELQGFDRGVVLPFDRIVHSQLAGANAYAIEANIANDATSIFVSFEQELDVNYVFDDYESADVDAQQVNIDPADFVITINDNDSIENPDILPTKRTFPTFVSRYFYDVNSLIVNLDLNFYQITDWDTLTTQTENGYINWMFGDSAMVTNVSTYENEEGEYDWNRTENVNGVWIPQWDNLLEARTDSGLVNWNYNGVESQAIGRFVPENDTLFTVSLFSEDVEILLDTVVIKDTTYIEWAHADTITANFRSYMKRGDITWSYGDSTIVSSNKNVPVGTLDAQYNIQGMYNAILDTTYQSTDSTLIDWNAGDAISITYTPGVNAIKTVEKAFDEVLTIPDSIALVSEKPQYDPVTMIISAPAIYAGSVFKDSVSTDDNTYWVLKMDYKYSEQGMRSGEVQAFSFDFVIPEGAVKAAEGNLEENIEPTKEMEDENVQVYPIISPTYSTLNVNNADEFDHIKIYSLSGQILVDTNLSSTYETIPVSQLNNGLYLVILSGSESRKDFVGKFVKQ
ncbi:T9SS type A sorting domain-containing protein [Labilibacter sediminis]|nr:T9SS type A sorting domain-containing protein [Labilibacter sediminis]